MLCTTPHRLLNPTSLLTSAFSWEAGLLKGGVDSSRSPNFCLFPLGMNTLEKATTFIFGDN